MARTGYTDAHRALAEYLAKARWDAGLKQEELAAKLGKDQPWVSNIETGLRRVDVIEFCAIARAVGVSPISILAALLDDLGELQI